jgi:hypothetical protein
MEVATVTISDVEVVEMAMAATARVSGAGVVDVLGAT